MEKLKPKHDHALTNIVKVFIFALMLLMPFLVFLPNGLYYGFNEHATNDTTTEINYKYESNEVNSLDDLVDGNVYYLENFYIDTQDSGLYEFSIYFLNADVIDSSFDMPYTDEFSLGTIDNKEAYLELYIGGDETFYFIFYLGNSDSASIVQLQRGRDYLSLESVYFIYHEYNDLLTFFTNKNYLPQYTDYNVIESVTENVEQTITQQMYNGWQTMWQTPLFNWTNNSILNTGLAAFCTAFGISNTSYITNFLTYELVIVAIYIVLDIVLTLFTWLTHIGQKE